MKKIVGRLLPLLLAVVVVPSQVLASQPPPNSERISIWESIGSVSMGFSSNSSLSWDRRLTGYVVKDKNGEVFKSGFFQTIYFSKTEANCWQIAPVNQYGRGPWSNEVCYSPPLPNKPTLYIYESLGRVTGFHTQPLGAPPISAVLIRDNFGTTEQRPQYEIRVDIDKSRSNCWEAAVVNAIGQSEWSNKVCYTLPTPTRAPQASSTTSLSCANSTVSIALLYTYLGEIHIDDLVAIDNLGSVFSFSKDALRLAIPNVDCSTPRSFAVMYRNSSGLGPRLELGWFQVIPATPNTIATSRASPSPSRIGALCADYSVVAQTGPRACSKRGGRLAWIVPDGSGSWATGESSDCVGICYGVPSKINGLPRNTYVSGYFRSDGTYVRPYTRSK